MDNFPINRRQMIKQGALMFASLATMPVFLSQRSACAAAAAKSDFHYQQQPHEGKRCAECTAFLPSSQTPDADGTCRIVAGPISPNGWCMAFSPK